MTKISLTAKLTAAEGKADELREALVALVAAGESEPGLEVYSVHGSPDDASVFTFFELYADEEALAVHGKGRDEGGHGCPRRIARRPSRDHHVVADRSQGFGHLILRLASPRGHLPRCHSRRSPLCGPS